MKYATVCSGIEACSVAWEPLGWEPQWFSEIDKFPCAVLAHHYPTVPNHGDMESLLEMDLADVDVFCGGTPCQSFSVAGLRGGMDDPRGNLAAVFCALAGKLRPRWVVWENVPGVLSSNGGRDFGSILGALAELGYGLAYRVLDAQYFGLAQRRKRVFVVGYLGDWRRAAAVLFEREGLRGDSAPSREAGKTAPTVPSCRTAGGGLGTDFDCDGGLLPVAHTLGRNHGNPQLDQTLLPVAFHENQRGDVYTMDIPGALGMGGGKPGQGYPAVAFETLYNNGVTHNGMNDASTQKADPGALLPRVRKEIGAKAFAQWGLGILDSLYPPEVLRSALHGKELYPARFSRSWVVHCALASEKDRPARAVQSLREAIGEGRPPQGWEPPEQLARELGAYLSELSHPGAQTEKFMRDLWQADEGTGLLREALSTLQEVRRPNADEGQPAHTGMSVRRLTPTECTFLQGFPRGFLDITYRNKPAADGPKYKALGNSMAVPVMAWIGRRIEAAEMMQMQHFESDTQGEGEE